jgi:hypothetical protein
VSERHDDDDEETRTHTHTVRTYGREVIF